MKYIDFEKNRKFDIILLGRVAIDFNPAYSDMVKEEFKPLKNVHYFGYPCSSNIDDNTFTIKSGHVYLKSRTDDQIVVRFKNACFSLSADGDYLLNGDLSFSISQ